LQKYFGLHLENLTLAPPWKKSFQRSCLGYILISRNAEGVHGQSKFGKPRSKPSLDLFPRKCTYAKVIDLRNMVLWSIGFIANRYRIPPH